MTSPNTAANNMLVGPIGLTLRKMTVPVVFGMIALMSFNLVDTFFISLLGTQPLAAVSFTFPVTFTIISLTIGLGIGTSAVIARHLGGKQTGDAKQAGTGAILLSMILVAITSLVAYFNIDPLFRLMGATDELMPYIFEYMNVWYPASLFLITPMIGNSILRASGDTKTPAQVMGFGGLINAVLDPILIFGWGPIEAMGVQGAAVATAVSWVIGTSIIVYIVAIKRQLVYVRPLPIKKFIHTSRSILKIGLPAAGANMMTPLAMAVLTAIVATYGEAAVAAFGVGSRIESIAIMVVLALSMTLPPFISQNFGAEQMGRVEEAYRSMAKFVMIWQLAISLLLIAVAGFIADVFARDEEVAELIKLFIYIMPLGYGLQGVIILSNSSFNALHRPMQALILSIIRLFVCYVPISYVGSLYWGLEGLFVGGVVANFVVAIISYRWFIQQFRTPLNTADTQEAK